MARTSLTALALFAALGCGGAAPSAIGPSDYDEGAPQNPTTASGAIIHLSFGSHHPSCFVMAAEGQTEDVPCPDDARVILEECPGGTLYSGKGAAEGACVCVPLDGEPERVACP